jgi:hypothetical protein
MFHNVCNLATIWTDFAIKRRFTESAPNNKIPITSISSPYRFQFHDKVSERDYAFLASPWQSPFSFYQRRASGGNQMISNWLVTEN